MKNRLIYVECKDGNDTGLAWIGVAGASKTGATIYSNGKAFRSCKGSGIGANYFDIETGDEYWISGIKKNNQDRHWAGGGDISIDENIIDRYLAETGRKSLPRNLIPTTLLEPKQQPEHKTLEHEELYTFSEDFTKTIPIGRSGSIKRKR